VQNSPDASQPTSLPRTNREADCRTAIALASHLWKEELRRSHEHLRRLRDQQVERLEQAARWI
jgi:hypothetical protein